MKKFLISLLVAAVLCISSVAVHATDRDIAKITCKDFLADKNNMGIMLMWIDGYMSAKSDNTTFNEQWMTKLTAHMVSFCTQNPGSTVMDAMNAMKD